MLTLIQDDLLPFCFCEGSGAPAASAETRDHLLRVVQLIQSGKRYAATADYMPLESMQFLLQHQTAHTALWLPDYTTPDDVWLAFASGCDHARTMTSAHQMNGYHIGLSREHFFHIVPDPPRHQSAN